MAKKLTKKLTKRQMRLIAYNNIITSNKKTFKAGSYMTRQEFITLFNLQGIVSKGSYQDVQRSNLKLVQAQMEINMLMRENGLYVKSEDYYSFFNVVQKEKTKDTVIRMSSEVDVYSSCASRLEGKLKERVTKGTWGTYNKVPSAVVERLGEFTPSKRHQRTIKRVTQY